MPETNDAATSAATHTAPPPAFSSPVSAKLARRLAAAADGYRTGHTVWFTARFEPVNGHEFDISEAIEQQGVANAHQSLKPGYGLFGPFQTRENVGVSKVAQIDSIVVKLTDGATVTIDPKQYDAMFWDSSSVDKFAVPHYATFLDLSMAQKLQRDFAQPNVYLVLHGPNTEYDLKSLPAEPSLTAFQVLTM